MGFRSFFAKPFAKHVVKKHRLSHLNALYRQDYWLAHQLKKAENTIFGQAYSFAKIRNYLEFKAKVPISEYEDLKSYIDEMVMG